MRLSRRAGRGQRGISLLEAIIGIAILSMAGALLTVNSRTSATGQERSKAYGEASAATKEALEHIDHLSLDSLSGLRNAELPHSQGSGVRVQASVRGVLPGDVDGFAGLDTTTLRHLTLVTSFRNRAGAEVSKSFTTIVYNP